MIIWCVLLNLTVSVFRNLLCVHQQQQSKIKRKRLMSLYKVSSDDNTHVDSVNSGL